MMPHEAAGVVESLARSAAVARASGRVTRSMSTTANQAAVEAGRAVLDGDGVPNVEEVLIPRLDAKEVAAVFTAPFEAFLSTHIPDPTPPSPMQNSSSPDAFPSAWYTGQWTYWHGSSWRMHNFYVPSSDQPVAWAEPPSTTMTMNRFRVFGMTARILVDAARVAFGREPEFEHNSHFGDEDLVGRLIREGALGERVRRGEGGVSVADGKGTGEETKANQEAKI
jgi:hypothetical protein